MSGRTILSLILLVCSLTLFADAISTIPIPVVIPYARGSSAYYISWAPTSVQPGSAILPLQSTTDTVAGSAAVTASLAKNTLASQQASQVPTSAGGTGGTPNAYSVLNSALLTFPSPTATTFPILPPPTLRSSATASFVSSSAATTSASVPSSTAERTSPTSATTDHPFPVSSMASSVEPSVSAAGTPVSMSPSGVSSGTGVRSSTPPSGSAATSEGVTSSPISTATSDLSMRTTNTRTSSTESAGQLPPGVQPATTTAAPPAATGAAGIPTQLPMAIGGILVGAVIFAGF